MSCQIRNLLISCVIIGSLCILTVFPICYITININSGVEKVQAQEYSELTKIHAPFFIRFSVSVESFVDSHGHKEKEGHIDVFTMKSEDYKWLGVYGDDYYITRDPEVYSLLFSHFYNPAESISLVIKNTNVLFSSNIKYQVIYVDLYVVIASFCLFIFLAVADFLLCHLIKRKILSSETVYQIPTDNPVNNL